VWKGRDLLDKSINDYFLRKKRGKKKHMIFYIILAIIILVVTAPIVNPLRRTDEKLIKHLFNITPIGTSMEDVIGVADKRLRWKIEYIQEDFGVVLNLTNMRPRRVSSSDVPNSKVIGQRALRVDLGTYYALLFIRTDVEAFYAFDGNGELIDIFLIRDHDLL